MKYQDALSEARVLFNSVGINNPALEARILLAHTVSQPIERILIYREKLLSDSEKILFESLIKRRASLEPIAYIIGYREFYDLKFQVDSNVLIPRPDTETLINAVLDIYSGDSSLPLVLLDLGTGSGCIAVTLLKYFQKAKAVAIDIDPKALSIAKINAELHGVLDRMILIQSDWFNSVPKIKFDLIVSNPPYISLSEKHLMSKEVDLYEPRQALFAGTECGTDNYQIIALQASEFAQKNIQLLVEIGFAQSSKIKSIFLNKQYIFRNSYKDISGHERILHFSI
jgi:release factor glutamine methyltransferase